MKCYIDVFFARTDDKGKIRYDWTVTDFCKNVGISRTYYYEIVKSEKVPTLEVAYKIVEYINNNNSEDYVWTVQDLWKDT